MKNKKILIIISFLIITSLLVYYIIRNNTDAKKFKREYESYNEVYDKILDVEYRNIKIPSNNLIKYSKASDIISLINNNKTFLVYFGDGSSHYCRLVIEELLKTLDQEGIDILYYVNINNIRDKKAVSDSGTVIEEIAGSSDYMKLTQIFSDVIDDYILYDDNEEIVLKEKRINDSTLIAVVNGVPIESTMGIGDYFTSVDMELTEKIKKIQHDEFIKIIDYVKPSQSCNEDLPC